MVRGAASSDSKKPFLKHFYKKKSDLFHVSEKWFDLHVNTVLYLGAGKDSRSDDMLYTKYPWRRSAGNG